MLNCRYPHNFEIDVFQYEESFCVLEKDNISFCMFSESHDFFFTI